MHADPPPPARQLSLASHVRACYIDGQLVLLDLMRNRYIGISGRETGELAGIVSGWPSIPEPTSHDTEPTPEGALARKLLAQGLLSDGPSGPSSDRQLEPATACLDFEGDIAGSEINARRLVRFAHSAASTAAWLRWRSLQAIACAVIARRERLETKLPQRHSLDAIRAAAAAYDRLRPLVLTAQDRCLHDSLALLAFLAPEGLHPRWVVGVRVSPFGAHSWVQSGPTVLNDQHDHVRRFSPILVV
jgi:hypothetical protein